VGSLFTELKRRKVVRVAVVYAATAFVVLQAADIMLPRLGVPEWAMSLIVVLVVLGFPVAMVLAWALELTPDGVRVTPATRQSDATEPAPSLLGGRTVAITALLVVLGIGLGTGWLLRPITTPGTPAGEAIAEGPRAAPEDLRASIAVLPFADLSPEGDQEYFSDGLAEEILNVLTRVQGLRVASRTSSFLFKGERKSIPVIAEELGVDHVLEGSVRKAGDQVRITAQLIAADGDAHLWSDTYDGELSAETLFALQDEIARAIVAALQEHVGRAFDGAIEVAAVTDNLDAYELYLQARQSMSLLTVESARVRVELLERAVEADPGFAEAWAELGFALAVLPTWAFDLEPRPYLERAIESAERALALDGANQRAFRALRTAYFYLHDWERADHVLERAGAAMAGFEPTAAELMDLGYLTRAYEVAKAQVERAPDDSFHKLLQGLYLEAVGRSEEAVEQFEKAILDGYHGAADMRISDIYWSAGQTELWTVMTATYLNDHDPELLPLLPHFRELMLADPARQSDAAVRFHAIARELGFETDDLLARGHRFGLRVPMGVAIALGHPEPVADLFWSNLPKFWMWSSGLHGFRQSDAFRRRVRDSGMLAHWRANGWPDLCRPVGQNDFECD